MPSRRLLGLPLSALCGAMKRSFFSARTLSQPSGSLVICQSPLMKDNHTPRLLAGVPIRDVDPEAFLAQVEVVKDVRTRVRRPRRAPGELDHLPAGHRRREVVLRRAGPAQEHKDSDRRQLKGENAREEEHASILAQGRLDGTQRRPQSIYILLLLKSACNPPRAASCEMLFFQDRANGETAFSPLKIFDVSSGTP